MSLVFVYNAKSGILNGAIDLVHKIVSPSTYGCTLCGITYGHLGMREEWRAFIDALPVEVVFAYPDTWSNYVDAPLDEAVPAAFQVEDRKARLLIPASRINACRSLDDLMHLVQERVPKA